MRSGERRRRAAVACALLLLGAMAGRSEPLSSVRRERYSMGTIFTVVAYHPGPAAAERAVEAAMTEIARLDRVLSHHDSRSELSRLNREGRNGFVAVEPSLYEVVVRSLEISRMSGGRFDVTIAPLLRVWRDAYDAGRPPAAHEIAGARRCVGYQRIEARPPNEVRFRSACLDLDLGGIGKGYAVDRALGVLASAGVRHAVVNAGGSTIGAIGAPPGLDGWPIDLGAGVPGRRAFRLRDGAVSTSQQRLRHLPFEAGTFGEVIDPGRAAPAPHEMSVSVVTPSATSADALSTALLLLPVADGKRLLARFPSTSALWLSRRGEMLDAFHASQLELASVP